MSKEEKSDDTREAELEDLTYADLGKLISDIPCIQHVRGARRRAVYHFAADPAKKDEFILCLLAGIMRELAGIKRTVEMGFDIDNTPDDDYIKLAERLREREKYFTWLFNSIRAPSSVWRLYRGIVHLHALLEKSPGCEWYWQRELSLADIRPRQWSISTLTCFRGIGPLKAREIIMVAKKFPDTTLNEWKEKQQ